MSANTPKEILSLPMGPNDPDAQTVGDYLKALLVELWDREEGFSGKRPFGNSGWKYEVYAALGNVDEMDIEDADRRIAAAINSIEFDG